MCCVVNLSVSSSPPDYAAISDLPLRTAAANIYLGSDKIWDGTHKGYMVMNKNCPKFASNSLSFIRHLQVNRSCPSGFGREAGCALHIINHRLTAYAHSHLFTTG